jgi:16S rRNA (cytidine1402-2'-O)-methyltransferase
MYGKLYLVSTPIGNPDDITLRAINIIKECDVLLAEERKPANALLKHIGISKNYILYNEHTQKELIPEVIELLESSKNVALISDAGTPVIADPGSYLVKECINRGIVMTAVPGASSILAALTVSGFDLSSFIFVGFLPRDKAARRSHVKRYARERSTLIFLEAPYRLQQLLDDLNDGLGKNRELAICTNLTQHNEKIYRMVTSEAKEHFAEKPFKGEFVIIAEGA